MNHQKSRARLIVVDDHDVARLGLIAILNGVPDLRVVAEGRDAASAIAATRAHAPDLVLLDVRMPDTEGLAAARQIRELCPRVRIVMVSSWAVPEYVVEAYQAGATGYIYKGAPRQVIVDEVHRVLRDEPLVTSDALPRIPRESKRNATIGAGALVERLTPRQREVLALIASGLSNTMIAQRLGIAVSTVRKLTEQVYRQLGVSNRTQAAMHWVIAAPQSEPDHPPGSRRRAASGR
jgi:DNA-binding NarL/FixJ family response regulator